VLAHLTDGGMGSVDLVEHAGQLRVCKTIKADHQGGANAGKRFRREAEITATFDHPHLVRCFGHGEDGERLYLVLEWVPGGDVQLLVEAGGPLPVNEALTLLHQAALGLAHAHGRHLVHRDIKPANLFVCRQGQDYDVLKVLDFGLVRPENTPGHTLITGDAAVAGTPAYMAPEYVTGESVGPPADLYALGCVGYWLLTGQRVFDVRSPIEQVMKHLNEAPAPIQPRSPFPVPDALEAALMQCLSKEPADRPPSTERLEAMLAAVPLERPWTPALAREAWRDPI
jgi:serine/threonine protein kinase